MFFGFQENKDKYTSKCDKPLKIYKNSYDSLSSFKYYSTTLDINKESEFNTNYIDSNQSNKYYYSIPKTRAK